MDAKRLEPLARVKIKYVTFGNKVSLVGGSSQYAQYILPAIQNNQISFVC